MISKFPFNSSPFIALMSQEEDKEASSEQIVSHRRLSMAYLHTAYFILELQPRIFTFAQQLIYFLWQEYPSSPLHLLVPFVYLVNSYTPLKTRFKYDFLQISLWTRAEWVAISWVCPTSVWIPLHKLFWFYFRQLFTCPLLPLGWELFGSRSSLFPLHIISLGHWVWNIADTWLCCLN